MTKGHPRAGRQRFLPHVVDRKRQRYIGTIPYIVMDFGNGSKNG
jgi:hypothetical protein